MAAEARVEHVEVRLEHARVDPVDRQGSLEAPHGGRHAGERVARDVGLDALGDQVVEEPVDQVLHTERQSQGVELLLVVVAVDRGDAGGDVALLVDVLGRHRGQRAEHDRFELFEHVEGGVEQRVASAAAGSALPGRERALEAAPHLRVEHEVPADRPAHVVGRERVLVSEQLVGAHHQGDAAPVVGGREARPEGGEPLVEGFGAERDEPVEDGVELVGGERPAVVAPTQGEQGLVRAPCPLPLEPHRRHGVVRHVGLEHRGVEGRPVVQHGPAEVDQAVRRLGVELLAQKVHERVAAPADLVAVGRDGAQLALGAHLAEVHRQRAQQLLGDEVDGPDVGVQKAGDVALEEVGVSDVHAAQPQLHVERRRQTLVERGVRLDDVHPAADLGQVVGIDDRSPVVGGAADVGVLKAPRQHVVDEVVDGLRVGRLTDGDADRLVALEAHQQELAVTAAEEGGEPAEDALDVEVPLGLHEVSDDTQQLDHGLLLAVAQGVVLQEEQAHGKTVLEVVEVHELLERPPQHVGEQRPGRREELAGRRPLHALGEHAGAGAGQKIEARGHSRGVGEPGALGLRPARRVEALADAAVADQQHLAVELEEVRRRRRMPGQPRDQVAQQGVALQEGRRLAAEQPGERAGDRRERVVVGVAVRTVEGGRAPREQLAQRQRELLGGQRRLEQPDDELGEQAEEPCALLGGLEVAPVVEERRLKAVDESVGVAKGVEVLGHGLDQRGAHPVEPLDGVDQRLVAVGDHHVLRRARDVRAQRV